MFKFISYSFATICQFSLLWHVNLSKYVCVEVSKQSHMAALWLYLVPAMCNRLVQEAGNKLQREESYKKMLLLRKQLRIAHYIFIKLHVGACAGTIAVRLFRRENTMLISSIAAYLIHERTLIDSLYTYTGRPWLRAYSTDSSIYGTSDYRSTSTLTNHDRTSACSIKIMTWLHSLFWYNY